MRLQSSYTTRSTSFNLDCIKCLATLKDVIEVYFENNSEGLRSTIMQFMERCAES